MPPIRKLKQFLTDSNFRGAQFRGYAWPLVRYLYPQIECIGVKGHKTTTLLFADDEYITRDFIKFGANIAAPMTSALKILNERKFNLSGCFYEIGANIGSESIEALISGPFSSAILVEPEPRNASFLRANLALNGVSHLADVVEAGASNEPGKATLTLSKNNRGDHRIATTHNSETPTIEIKTADGILLEVGRLPADISLVWIDTQGYDGFVLAGAKSLMAAKVPFVMEFTPDAMRDVNCYDLCLETMQSEFSAFYNLSDPSPRMQPMSSIVTFAETMKDARGYVDLLLIP